MAISSVTLEDVSFAMCDMLSIRKMVGHSLAILVPVIEIQVN
jgi:hypothetical protein